MTSHHRTHASAIGAVLGAAGLTVVATAIVAPAQGAASLTYTCTVPVLGSMPFTVTDDSSAPASMRIGQSAKVRLTSKVTVPSSVVEALYAFGGRTADGTADAHGSIGGKATTATLTVPTTDVPESGSLPVVATGNGGTFRATRTGAVRLASGDFTATLNVYDENGDPLSTVFASSPVTFSCTAPANGTFDTITVRKDTTRTDVVAATVRKGRKATVRITVGSVHGTTPTGKVKVRIKKGRKTIEKKVVRLRHGRAAAKMPVRLKEKGTYKAVARYVGTSTLVKSSGAHKFKVR